MRKRMESTVEASTMKHELCWDEENSCVRLTMIGEFEPDEAVDAMSEVGLIFEGKSKRLLLVDGSDSPRVVSRETRAVLQEHSGVLNPDKLAFFGMSNLNRIVARIIVAIIGNSGETKFFVTEDEALAWFREPS